MFVLHPGGAGALQFQPQPPSPCQSWGSSGKGNPPVRNPKEVLLQGDTLLCRFSPSQSTAGISSAVSLVHVTLGNVQGYPQGKPQQGIPPEIPERCSVRLVLQPQPLTL